MKIKLIKKPGWYIDGPKPFVLKLIVKGREHEIDKIKAMIERYLTDPSRATIDSLIIKG